MAIWEKMGRKPKEDNMTVESLNFKDIEFEANEIQSEIVVPEGARMSAQVAEINGLKKNLTKMSSALRDSMRLSQDSVDEIEKLSRFLKTAEVSAMSLERLQPENSNLKTKLENAQSELTKKSLWASEVESRSIAYKARFEETHDELEAARAKLSHVEDNLKDQSHKRNESDGIVDRLQSERGDLLIIVEDLKTENAGIKDEILKMREVEVGLARRNTELSKQAEMLTARISDERRDKELTAADLKALRLDYSELKADHIETLSKLDKARHEINAGQLTVSELRSRTDDKIFALNSAIEGLKAQQKINDDMSRYDDVEKSKLKSDLEREKVRANELKGSLDQSSKEMKTTRKALSQAKANYEILNEKFLKALAELDTLRRDHEKKARKLEEYSSISGIAVGQSFYDDSAREANKGQTVRGDGSIPNLKLVTKPSKKK